MAATYTLISSNTLGTTATSVTFSSIPSTYTDLVLRWSSRTNGAGNVTDATFRFNGSSGAAYTTRILYSNGSSIISDGVTARVDLYSGFLANGGASTANTFSNNELYIPSYTSSLNKSMGIEGRTEQNSTNTAETTMASGLWSNTAAITSLTIYSGPTSSPTDSFVAGSSFYLYGIKNS